MRAYLIISVAVMGLLSAVSTGQQPEWGKPSRGLQSSLTVVGKLRAKGTLNFVLTLRNTGTAAVPLPPADTVSGWLFMGQGYGRSFYSAPVKCCKGNQDWPKELAPGKSIKVRLATARISLFRFGPGLEIVEGYPQSSKKIKPKSVGLVRDVVSSARPAAISWILNLPKKGKLISVTSNALQVEILPPQLADMDPAEQEAYLDAMLARFLKSAESAKEACPEAVALGGQITKRLVAAVMDRKKTPAHSRMWLATALAGIADEASVQALTKLVNDPEAGVRNVVAYHGARPNRKVLNEAILARATKPGDVGFSSWALRGITTFQKTRPKELIAFGLKSKDLKFRVGSIVALGKNPTKEDVETLHGLVRNKDERTRAAAANALAVAGKKDKATLRVLTTALDDAGDYAKMYICRSLDKLTNGGGKYIFDAQTDPDRREAAVAFWKAYGQKLKESK